MKGVQRLIEQMSKSSKRVYPGNVLEPRRVEGAPLWPVTESGWVASDADPLGARGCRTIEDEQHVPAERADVDIGRRFDGTVIAVACHLGEDDTSSHQVAMSAGGSGDERDPHVCRGTLEEMDGNVVGLTVIPMLVGDGVCGLGLSLGQIRRDIDFNSEFFGEFCSAVREVGLGVRPRDKDATIGKEDRLGVVHASDDGAAEFRDTLAMGESWVVKESLQIREVCQSETGNTLLSAVQDEESAIRKGGHASHHTAGRLEDE